MLGVVAGVLGVVGPLSAGVVGAVGVDAPLLAGPPPVSAGSLGDVGMACVVEPLRAAGLLLTLVELLGIMQGQSLRSTCREAISRSRRSARPARRRWSGGRGRGCESAGAARRCARPAGATGSV